MSAPKECVICGEWVYSKRWALGYHTCLCCANKVAAKDKYEMIKEFHKREAKAGWEDCP